ncbi:MAG: hypothetical protein PWP14_1585 [Methanolobus sp.]|nr:hypothetical protein [Methanolobus sp.]
MKENVIIPDSGLVSLGYLSELTGVNIERLTQTLTDYGVPFIKLGGYRRDWYVNLKKIADIAYEGKGGV